MSTLFTKIINGEIPSYKIYEDDHVYAFLDIFPQKVGHTLVVPKIEVDHFSEVPEPYYSAIFTAAKRISLAISKATWCTRVCTGFAGYEVPHCHYHVIPTDSIDEVKFSGGIKADDADLAEMQKNILQHLS